MYKCSGCGKTLYSRSHLESHKSRCRGLGFKCPLCLNVYPSFQALRLHVRKSHGDLWNRCPICNRKFKLTLAHYIRVKDDDHRILWMLTVSPRVRSRKREPRTIRGIMEKYGWFLSRLR
jgi:DNA-directed RNA polymerase subunit RPC12/RpoP